jgi:ATP-binding cassette subfamily C (CFTR/MRP) protein 1
MINQLMKDSVVFEFFSAALAFSLPVLAATLAFVTYTHVVPGFDVAVIFASLSLFQARCILLF